MNLPPVGSKVSLFSSIPGPSSATQDTRKVFEVASAHFTNLPGEGGGTSLRNRAELSSQASRELSQRII